MESENPPSLNVPFDLTSNIRRILFSEEDLHRRVAELGADISEDYQGLNPLVIGVLKGMIFFMTDLLRAITIPVTVDFMAISRYSPSQPSKGAVRLTKDLDDDVHGRHVIFVEDVIDTGLTASYLLRILRARGPASIHICALFNKAQHRLVDIPLRYKGFDLGDRFVVGYGLDYREQYRHLPYVAELRPEVLNLVAAGGKQAG